MPKPVFTCDICKFKCSNSYIFKRHLHRCYSLHGIASKRSSPRNPIRLKGTENLNIKSIDSDAQENMEKEDDGDILEKKEGAGPDVAGHGGIVRVGDGTESVCSSVSQWGVSDSPLTIVAEAGDDAGADSSNKSMDKNADNGKLGTPYARRYTCKDCGAHSKNAREHLYHMRDAHGNTSKIHECNICHYASRYHNKVERHMVVHKLIINMQDRKGRSAEGDDGDDDEFVADANGQQDAEKEEETSRAGGRLRVKPLKLRRLNIKMPFKVSGGNSDTRSPPHLSPANTDKNDVPSKAVYKRVLREDGNYMYQCRDCLYYARLISKVKKHHSLCHSKTLGCPHCDMTTTSQGILYEHLITHSGHGYVQCPDCSYVTNAKSNYEKHRTFHESVFPFNCTVCNFGSDSVSKIKRHITSQHTPTTDAGGTVSQGEILDTSQESAMDTEEASLLEQEEDFALEGNGKPQRKEQKSSSGPVKIEYKCPKCVMVCYRRGNFTRHLSARHGYSQLSASQLSKTMENRMFKGFKRRVVGVSSRIGGHPTVTESLKCTHCSYMAKWPSDLRRHMQVHTLFKRFKCTVCPNKYKYHGDLNVHMRRDHNMEPPESASREVTSSAGVIKKASPAIFRCPICPFSCQNKAELEQHSRSHSNITKTFQCRLCDYQTYWRGDVGRHLFRHHEVVLSKDATEIEEYFILRPDIRPLTKQGPAAAMSTQAVFPGNPDPPVLQEENLDKPQEEVTNSESLEELGGNDTSWSNLSTFESETPKLSSPPLMNQSSVSVKEGSLVCEYPNCNFKASTAERMEVHIALHLNIKMFMCPTCGKRTNWKWDIVKHMSKVHSNPRAVVEDVITLSMEEAKASIGQYMATFEKRSKELTINFCSLCGFKSLEKNRVVRHMGTVHKNQNGKVLSRMIENPEDLDSSQTQAAERDVYEASETHEMKPPTALVGKTSPSPAKFQEPSPEELAKYEKPYACAICKKAGVTKGDVKKHYNYTHPYKDVRVVYLPDGTEFNYYSGEIYSKKTPNLQEEGDVGNSSPFMSLFSGKTVKPDSKYSNPKMHGYVKPFKCSICGIRSNWKWDLKKHLRSKHPNGGGFVIMLSIEEASQTYGTECSPSHPAVPVSRPSLISNNVFKAPLNIKEERLDDTENRSDAYQDLSSSQQSLQSSPLSPVNKTDRTFPDPSRRQWKCSGCDYISNWRRNMARHIHRKHPNEKGSIRVLPLHRLSASQLSSLPVFNQQSINSFFSKRRSSVSKGANKIQDGQSVSSERSDVSKTKQNGPGSMRLWRCSRCPYKSVLKTHIIGHMQQHGIKPFKCGVCHMPFMNRGPLHKHLQKVHQCEDYIRQCKVVITYDGEETDGATDFVENGNNYASLKRLTSPNFKKAEYINSFFCRLCNLESADREEILAHLESFHGSVDNDNNVLKIQKRVSPPTPQDSSPVQSFFNTSNDSSLDSSIRGSGRRKLHYCHVCPYRTQKKQMLAFHMTYHRPTVSNRFKCKYCPYYVSTVRLLHQHQRKWHEGATMPSESPGATWSASEQKTPPTSPTKTGGSPGSASGRRHMCEKCPYTTNSKNDFIYHKQFHRPKRTAEFKCEYCDYWVVHKRLLKQHVRLHTKQIQAEASNFSSPAKSLYSDPGLVYDPAELTELAGIKQKMISAKVTASLSQSPSVSPMKLASSLTVDSGKPGYVMKNGMYRKLHKCKKCPYTNVRARNMQLHEMMHGPRHSPHPLMKCPYCDYYVGSKGLLSHHMKVHQKSYGDTPENDAEMAEQAAVQENTEESDHEIQTEQKVDTLLQISRFKRFGCERCPYASAKRQHFERHLELHGSRQRYTCQYCDYSVPSNNLLLQHTKLHMMPNQNLLASQSVTNLHHLSEVPADVALASALPPADTETTVTISVIHDHLGLYENSIYDSEPKKLYRCDRCPYANVRRDYLLSHLKFHMVASAFACPYCDYSAPKQSLLTQHIRVHFCPLPELSDWLLENGQTERETTHRQMDLGEALKVAREYQSQNRSKSKLATEKASLKTEQSAGKENVQNCSEPVKYICQYCDREFPASGALIKHELQHLIGNHFERTEYVDRNKKEIQKVENKQRGETTQDKQETGLNSQDKAEIVTNSNNEKELSTGVLMNGHSSEPSSQASPSNGNVSAGEELDNCTENISSTDTVKDGNIEDRLDGNDIPNNKDVADDDDSCESKTGDDDKRDIQVAGKEDSFQCAKPLEDPGKVNEVIADYKREDEQDKAEEKKVEIEGSTEAEKVWEENASPKAADDTEKDSNAADIEEVMIEEPKKSAEAENNAEAPKDGEDEKPPAVEASCKDLCTEGDAGDSPDDGGTAAPTEGAEDGDTAASVAGTEDGDTAAPTEGTEDGDSAASVAGTEGGGTAGAEDLSEKELLAAAEGELEDCKADGINITDQDDKLLEGDDD